MQIKFLRSVSLCLAIFLIVIAIACSPGEPSHDGNSDDAEDPGTASGLGIREQAETEGALVTVYSAGKTGSYTWTAMYGVTHLEEAPPGKVWVIVEAAVESKIDGDQVIASLSSFSLNDSDGIQYQPYWGYYGAGGFQGAELSKGEVTGGKILFEVPVEAAGFQLTYRGIAEIEAGAWRLPF